MTTGKSAGGTHQRTNETPGYQLSQRTSWSLVGLTQSGELETGELSESENELETGTLTESKEDLWPETMTESKDELT